MRRRRVWIVEFVWQFHLNFSLAETNDIRLVMQIEMTTSSS